VGRRVICNLLPGNQQLYFGVTGLPWDGTIIVRIYGYTDFEAQVTVYANCQSLSRRRSSRHVRPRLVARLKFQCLSDLFARRR